MSDFDFELIDAEIFIFMGTENKIKILFSVRIGIFYPRKLAE